MRRLISLTSKLLFIFCILFLFVFGYLPYNRALAWITAARIGQDTSLDLRTLAIAQLPSEIGTLTNLTELYLDSSELNTLTPEIGNLYNLRLLSLSGNQLRELPTEIGNLIQLESLNLINNHLTKLPPEIANLTNLRAIYLAGNSFDAPQAVIEQGDWAIFNYYAKG